MSFNSLAMSSSLISVDLKVTRNADLPAFTGSAFRGWLGTVLRCARPECLPDCPDADRCPYRMVFKEKEIDINPYALLAFRGNGGGKGFIKGHGDRKRYIPPMTTPGTFPGGASESPRYRQRPWRSRSSHSVT